VLKHPCSANHGAYRGSNKLANSEGTITFVPSQPKPDKKKAVKIVYVYDPAEPGVVQGTLLDSTQLERLAAWLCSKNCKSLNRAQDELENEKQHNGGYCDECRDEAGFLLSECPYIDMARPDKQIV
jgi:hypothetical protein